MKHLILTAAALLALAGDAAARGGERAAREIERCAGEVAGPGNNRPTHCKNF